MQSKLKWIEGVGVLELEGRFDAHEAPEVRRLIEDAADREHPQLLVNLADVNFIDSSGLSTLVQGMKRCRGRDGDLSLCNLEQPVRIIFELTRLDKAFDIYASEGEAIAALLGSVQST